MKTAKEGDILGITANTHQQDLERLKSLRYIDDDFMTVCLADNYEDVELILRIVLGREDIIIKSVRTQELLKNLQGRSAILDVHAIDSTKREFDVEIQRSDAGAGAKRDVETNEGNELFGDGSHIIYVNGKYRGNDKIGKLMHDFSCANPDDMNYEALAKKARYFKQDEKGVAIMCKIMEDMRNEKAKEVRIDNALRMIKDGELPLEKIALYSGLSVDEVKELATPVMA